MKSGKCTFFIFVTFDSTTAPNQKYTFYLDLSSRPKNANYININLTSFFSFSFFRIPWFRKQQWGKRKSGDNGYFWIRRSQRPRPAVVRTPAIHPSYERHHRKCGDDQGWTYAACLSMNYHFISVSCGHTSGS